MRGITLWQTEIIEKIGEAAIEEAEKRLCKQCNREGECVVLSLCSDGSDCPYFDPEGKET